MILRKLVLGSGLLLILLLTGSYQSVSDSTYSLNIKVTNIRNNKGTMQFQVYRSQQAFEDENPYKVYRVSKKSVSNKTLTYKIQLPKGTYGVALLDDENSNKEMDYGLVMPEEGFGFSDYYHTAWSKPSFSKFKFYLGADKSVVMKVRYV